MSLPSRLAGAASWLLAAAAGAQPVKVLLTPTAGIPATVPSPPRALDAADVAAGTRRAGPVRFDRALLAEMQRVFAGQQEAPARTVAVVPFADVTFHLTLRRSPAAAATSGALTVLAGEARRVGGDGAGDPPGTFSLVLHGGTFTLSVFAPSGNYHVRYGRDERLEAYEEDPAAPVACGNLRRAPDTAPPAAAGPEVAVLVLYTTEAASALGGDEQAMQAEVAKGIDLANAALRNAEVRRVARLAGGAAVRALASLGHAASLDGDLAALRASAEVAELKRRHGADVVVLARDGGDAWTVAAPGAGVVQSRKLADG
ncbi:hypothetical protein PYV61_24965, partial [Roseisolibacter sp. H3M3-2]